jgi:hypothetical protein
MSDSDSTAGRRTAFLLLLCALATTSLPALGLAATSAEAALEACQSCDGCEDGRCDELSPFASGEHCCPLSCLVHSLVAFSAPQAAPASLRCEGTVRHDPETPLQLVPQDIYQPPRR